MCFDLVLFSVVGVEYFGFVGVVVWKCGFRGGEWEMVVVWFGF